MKKRILVLGASGFLGSVLLKNLKQCSFESVVGTGFKQCHGTDLIGLNIYDAHAVRDLLADFQPDVIVWCLMDMEKEDVLTSQGLNAVLGQISHKTHVVYLSTDGFQGGTGHFSEETTMLYVEKSHAGAVYTNGKLDGERMVLDRGDSTVIRTGPIYGQNALGQWDKRIKKLIKAHSIGEGLAFSDNLIKTFVHVEDLAELIIEVINHRALGLFHAGPEERESYYSFHHKMARRLGLDQTLITAYSLSQQVAEEKGLTFDTSMNTEKIRRHFKTRFRAVEY